METHEGNNMAGPQRQVPSFFKEESLSQGNGTPETSAAPAPGGSGNIPPESSAGDSWDSQSKNPYQLEQSSGKNAPSARLDIDPFAQSTGSNLLQKIKERLFPEIEGVNPARQKAMVILVPVLAIVMIFVFRQVLSKAPQETEGSTNDDAPVVSTVHSDNEIDWKVPEPIPVMMRDPIKISPHNTYDNNGQVDMSNEMGAGIMSVRGILYSDYKPSAVIGNKIVHLNETINGAKIVKIDKDYVVFEKDGKTWMKKVAELNEDQEQEGTEQQEQEQTEQNQEINERQGFEEDL